MLATAMSFSNFSVKAQTDRKVAVLDMTNYNSETSNSRRLSCIRLLRQIGVPHDTTSSLTTALQYPIVITSSRILQGSFSSTEISDLDNYVANGGVLITSSMREPLLYNVCGISNNTSDDSLYTITFDTTAAQIYDYIDDSLEVKVSLGDSMDGPTFFTRYYDLTTASSLANYENGTCALAMNNYGSGTVYTFGPDFRDITYRNHMNFDVNAHRTYSNGFEPTGDVFMLVVRNIIRKHIPNAVYKYTVPHDYTSVLMITHDIDSKTGIDTLFMFSQSEKNMGIVGHYNVTTRYFSDTWMSNYYIDSWPEIHQLVDDGHTIASHSVGHFPDFADDVIFPFGTLGNTVGTYAPSYTGGATSGGTILGELEVSRDILQNDHGVNIRSFRAGHLAYPDSLGLGLEVTGYEFNSTYSANDVLSSFPYYTAQVRTFNGIESTVLEIPMTISDVFSSDPITELNYPQKVAIWTDATNRYDANHSPVVLLIHPNRGWKLTAQEDYLSGIPGTMLVDAFENFGDYWRKRDSLQYTTTLTTDTLTVTIDDALLTQKQSFVIDFGNLDTVIFENLSGSSLDFEWKNWDHGTRLYYQIDTGLNVPEIAKIPEIKVYPNPTQGVLNIVTSFDDGYEVFLFNLSGQLLFSDVVSGSAKTLQLQSKNLESGTYILVVKSGDHIIREKISYIR
ncbi:MAG: T9SS type A sorting domain-containing protein [Crocinitomicaceae bacterium]|nr:T9SS type A sorting domain-containing protein [Crocinitomicaceae bacterium]